MTTVRSVVHPGWIEVVGPEVHAVVAAADRHAEALTAAAADGVLGLLEALSAHGLAGAPDLAAVSVGDDAVRVVVRGAGAVVLADGTRITAEGRRPWRDVDVDLESAGDEVSVEAPEPEVPRGWRRPARLARPAAPAPTVAVEDARTQSDLSGDAGTAGDVPDEADAAGNPPTAELPVHTPPPPPPPAEDVPPPPPADAEPHPRVEPAANPTHETIHGIEPGPPVADEHAAPDVTTDRGALHRTDDDLDRPVVLAVLCPAGHPSPPHAGNCRTCGREIPPQQPFQTPRPSLGLLRISTGGAVPLDRGVLLGRAPRVNEELPPSQRPHPLRVGGVDRDISRNHAEVVLEGWHVLVRDLGSTNGTTVTLPGQEPVRLRPTEDHGIEPGAVITLADEVSLTYEVDG